MIYNSHRSSIVLHENKETRNLPLYLGVSRADYRTLDLAVNLLGRNLRNILSALERIKERQGFGKIGVGLTNESSRVKADQDQSEEPEFQNKIL